MFCELRPIMLSVSQDLYYFINFTCNDPVILWLICLSMFPIDFYHLEYYFEFLADWQLGQIIQCWKEYQQQTRTGGVITTKCFSLGNCCISHEPKLITVWVLKAVITCRVQWLNVIQLNFNQKFDPNTVSWTELQSSSPWVGTPLATPIFQQKVLFLPPNVEFQASVMPTPKNQHWEGRKHHNCPN